MSETILVIDDSTNIRENVSELLELSGYKVLSAHNGRVGLEMAKEFSPDLILCDIRMPEMDGYDVIQALSVVPGTTRIPIIFTTAMSEKSDYQKAMQLGAAGYLIKPFDEDELLGSLKRCLPGR